MIVDNKVYITAHAGIMNAKKDNLKCIEAGLICKVDIIEIDLDVDLSGNLVLSHDEVIENLKYTHFKRVLELILANESILLNINIKNTLVLKQLKTIISEYDILDRVFLSGLNFDEIIKNMDYIKGMHYLVNIDNEDINELKSKELANKLKNLSIMGINVNYDLLSLVLIKYCRKNKIQMHVWTVDETVDTENLLDYNINLIDSNNIEILKRKLKLL